MHESCEYGSVRGAGSNLCPYRERAANFGRPRLLTLMRRGVSHRQAGSLHFTELKVIDVRAQTWQIVRQTGLDLLP